jgi:hypothetical protein
MSIGMPFGERSMPLFLVAPAALAFATVFPLVDWWPSFSNHSVRESFSWRLLRVAGTLVLLVSGSGGALVSPLGTLMLLPMTLMTAIALTAVTLVGDLYWLVVLATFTMSLPFILSADGQSWFFEWVLEPKSALVAAASLAVGGGAYASLGPGFLRKASSARFSG